MQTVYLIPAVLQEDGIGAIHPSILERIKDCQVFFVENERTTRRYFKQLWKSYLPGTDIIIDNYEWISMDSENAKELFRQRLKEKKNIGIVSEAGCPGVADPGQEFIEIAQQVGVKVKPLVGPNSVLLALMASGMNGQQFKFNGYLPIDLTQKIKALKELESESSNKKITEIFIETPYRNNQLIETILKSCKETTRLCLAADITGANEWIKTKTIKDWKKEKPDLHKRPVIYLLQTG